MPARVDAQRPRLAFVRAESVTRLWTQGDAHEWRLTAGKVQNLRVAARALDGLVLPAHAVFSFWAALGRPLAWKGYVPGRELREGCLVASVGGGLCQLSNALYAVALQAGARIVERHAHSRVVPGSQAETGHDATVFWNYLDLRFSLPEPVELEVRLDRTHLVVRLRALSPSCADGAAARASRHRAVDGSITSPVRDCGTCRRRACPDRFVATSGQGTLAAAVPVAWPEHLAWARARQPALLHLAEDVSGWRVQASRVLAWASRRQPAAWRRSVLAVHDARARAWARRVDAGCDELIVPLDWLAVLACDGVLQGRRYDVLMTREPLAWLQQGLDEAAAHLPHASLGEYRASRARVAAEMEALGEASRLVTPHAALGSRLAATFPGQVVRLAWRRPPLRPAAGRGMRILLPASALARLGAAELQEVCRTLGCGLTVWGTAREPSLAWKGVDVIQADPRDPWRDIAVVALPAWVASSPRRLIEALARGLPVVATPACGLPPDTQGLHLVPAGDVPALVKAVSRYCPRPAAARPFADRT
jgi:hypothetical protein